MGKSQEISGMGCEKIYLVKSKKPYGGGDGFPPSGPYRVRKLEEKSAYIRNKIYPITFKWLKSVFKCINSIQNNCCFVGYTVWFVGYSIQAVRYLFLFMIFKLRVLDCLICFLACLILYFKFV